MPIDVDENVNAILGDPSGRRGVVEAGEIDEMVALTPVVCVHRIVGPWADVIEEDLDPASVMQPGDLKHQKADRMDAQIG